MTKQHVYDDWLRNLGYDGEGLREFIAEPDQPVFQSGGPFTKTLRIVCEDCNGAWLSTMEEAAKPLLISMFRTSGRIELDSDAQLTLARWAFKIVCVLSQMGRIKTFPLAHCREFRRTGLPPATSQIWIGAASVRTEPGREQLAESRYEPRVADLSFGASTVRVPFYVARFRLLNVVFDVFGHGPAHMGLRADLSDDLRRALLPIWPSEHPVVWWPPVTNLDVIGGIEGLAAVPLVGVPPLFHLGLTSGHPLPVQATNEACKALAAAFQRSSVCDTRLSLLDHAQRIPP
jgi:hypothetical protein